jgi:hypothetical protein
MQKELAPSLGAFLLTSSGVDRRLHQWPELTIPSANQCEFAALWIRSKGLVHGNVGVGESMPLIWKSPLGDTCTPAGDVLLSPKGGVDRQLRVANTFVPAGTPPAPLPPPRSNPFP